MRSTRETPALASTLVVLLALMPGPQLRGQEGVAAEAPIEAISLLGQPLRQPELTDEFRELQSGLLEEARAVLGKSPDDPDAAIWVGRRTAYLGRYREAIEIYSRALAKSPGYAKLYRHRGHRFITLRRFDEAIADLERAAELIEGLADETEQDGLPNERGIPTSTSHANIWYHLGLVRYLTADFAGAADAWARCRGFATNPDMDVAAAYWLYLSLRRSGDEAGAKVVLESIAPDLDIIENHDYYQLLRAFAAGGAAPDELLGDDSDGVTSATRAYGVAAFRFLENDRAGARELFESIVAGDAWAAFGYIAAEAELAR
jgi:tetratricopeptide (TPR) repeat protein